MVAIYCQKENEKQIMSIHVGVDLGGSKVRIVSSVRGQLVSEQSTSGPEFTPEMLSKRIEEYCTAQNIHPDSIGIAIPGLLQPPQIIQCDDLPNFSNTDGSTIGIPGVPTALLNDVDAGLIDALTHLPSDATCLLIMAGTTIGASVAINGKPFSGVSGFAGELGYFPIIQDCESTRLDKVAGGRYIISQLGVSPEEITSGILHGEQKYISAVNNAGQTLGRVISGIMSLINPSHVVVGGGTLRFPGYFESMQNEIERTCLNPILKVCSITKAASGENVVANGALLAGKAKMIVSI
jgi:predicted NBD/HSP70 family sugar kinase